MNDVTTHDLLLHFEGKIVELHAGREQARLNSALAARKRRDGL
jgi:hypothetical protein